MLQDEEGSGTDLVAQLSTSFNRLKTNMAHNRNVFQERSAALLGRITELERTIQDAVGVLEKSSSAMPDTLAPSPMVVDEHRNNSLPVPSDELPQPKNVSLNSQ